MTPASSNISKRAKRQRKAPQIFERGVNPAPPTPPSTVRRLQRSPDPTSQRSRDTPSPLFEPEASQLATDAHAAEILGEDDDEMPVEETPDDEDAVVEFALQAASAVESEGVGEQAADSNGSSPSVAAPASAAQSSQQQHLESQDEEIDEVPHLHFRWRACWCTIERGAIATAARATRNKSMYSISEDSLWQWAGEVVEGQKPRVAKIDSLTATLYYTGSRQAKADRTTLALQQQRVVAGERFEMGNWHDLVSLVEEMNKESSELLKCDFDLVLKDAQPALQPALQPAAQQARSVARARPGIVTAIQEEGLAEVVTAEYCATGPAIGIRDYWRCLEERCKNKPLTCWIQRPPGRQVDRYEDHYPVNCNIIAS